MDSSGNTTHELQMKRHVNTQNNIIEFFKNPPQTPVEPPEPDQGKYGSGAISHATVRERLTL